MPPQYLFGGIITLLLGVLLFIRLRGKDKEKKKDDESPVKVVNNVIEQIGECSSEASGDVGGDIIIVGAGVVGSALAYTLAKDGRRVHVIERNLKEPDRIVGEFLQPGGYLKLIELGLEDCVEEIDAQQIYGYVLCKDGRSIKVSYPLEKDQSNVAARSFHNGRFIRRMREKAANLPNVHMEQGSVTSLLKENGTVIGVSYRTEVGKELKTYAPLTVVCDGCFSNLRRSLCSPKIDVLSHFVGLVLEDCRLPCPNYAYSILGDHSIVLFYPISSTEVRCLVDVRGRVPSISNGEMATYLKTIVAPQITDELHDAFVSAIDRGNIRVMPNKTMPAFPCPIPGALLLGDAFNMRHPLTGGGMTVALSDIVVLRNLLKSLRDLNDTFLLRKCFESFHTLRKTNAFTVNTIADVGYKVYNASSDQVRNEMLRVCMGYISLGGACSEGAMALLSCLDTRPSSILSHFVGVAIYMVGHFLLPFPSRRRLLIGAKMSLVSSRIIFDTMRMDEVRQVFFPATVHDSYRAPTY